ncbi:MAG TPA: hypothetical protein VKU41_19005 [Polyangiaceae bacterium]|nr:hypothetical protein [Polyangiaceae bacterium]
MIRSSVALLVLAACAPPAAPPPPAGVPAAAPADFVDEARPLARYHSKRLALSLPLPDGAAWRIDDHTRPELVATHGTSQSTVVVAVFHADGLVGRTQCEDLARERRLAPADGPRSSTTLLADEVTMTQETFDTHIRVALESGASAQAPLVGRVTAFGGFLRKCYVFLFSTRVDSAAQEPVLSSRLAFARTRILGGLELDAFASPPRDTRDGPRPARTP